MSEASLKRALELITTVNDAVVTVAMVRAMAQRALDAHAGMDVCAHKHTYYIAHDKVCTDCGLRMIGAGLAR